MPGSSARDTEAIEKMILKVSRILVHLRMVFLFFFFMWEILAFASLSGNVSGRKTF